MSNVIGLSEEHEANLRKLAAYLKGGELRADFDMEQYAESDHCARDATSCGSVGCAVGHGPYAGIRKHEDEGWEQYSNRVFGLFSTRFFVWCFNACWREIDNTPQGAAARIEWLLDNGLPKDFALQKDGDAPLCYREGAAQ